MYNKNLYGEAKVFDGGSSERCLSGVVRPFRNPS